MRASRASKAVERVEYRLQRGARASGGRERARGRRRTDGARDCEAQESGDEDGEGELDHVEREYDEGVRIEEVGEGGEGEVGRKEEEEQVGGELLDGRRPCVCGVRSILRW